MTTVPPLTEKKRIVERQVPPITELLPTELHDTYINDPATVSGIRQYHHATEHCGA
jgi:hypothetical protein